MKEATCWKCSGGMRAKERREQSISGNFLIEAFDEGLQRFGSSEPFVESGDVGGHGGDFSASATDDTGTVDRRFSG